jgi:integrase
MKAKITKRSIDELKSKAKAEGCTLFLRDDDLTGFGAVATKSGACRYFIEYRLAGRDLPQRRMTIAKHGAVTADEARKLAKEGLGKVAGGADIAQQKKEAREKLTGVTFRDLIERYLGIHAKNSKYWTQKRARLLSDDLKALHGKPAALIKRTEIVAAIDKVHGRSQSAARALFADIRPILAWAHDRAAIEQNPIAGMKGPQSSDARDRVLSDDEIKAFWQAASEQGWPFEGVLKALLLTGQRREEVAGLRWREVELDAGVWTIAKERCKNGKAHAVDLCPEACRLLSDPKDPRLQSRANDLVFSTTSTTPVSGFSKVKKRVDARMKELLGDKFEPWRIHDLRRTAASGMAALKFQPHVIERVLNHLSGAQGGLVGVYQHHDYREERREAIMAWGAKVMEIVGEEKEEREEKAASNVVSLRAA